MEFNQFQSSSFIGIIMEFYILSALILGFISGSVVGYLHCRKQMIEELTTLISDQIELIRHEIVNNEHYLYFVKDDIFAGQGNTIEKAAENFSLNSKGIIGHVKETPLAVPFFIVDGKIERVEE